MIVVTDKEIYSDASKYVHRIGTETYFKRSIKLPNDSVEMFEEVDSIPTPPTEEDLAYKADVEEKVKALFFRSEIPKVINTYGLSDKEALEVKNLYPLWKEGIDVKVGERYGLNDKLYQVAQEHTTQENWRPDKMSSLWFEVSYHEGTKDDPIPFNEENDPLFQGMILELGKFYKQDGVVYECIRDSQGVKIVQDLAGLVDNYVKVVK